MGFDRHFRWTRGAVRALAVGIAMLAGASQAASTATPRTAPADLVFVNGGIYTVDAARSWASALVVRSGHIVYVGTNTIARTFIGPRTRVIDLTGRMLLPGFTDCLAHASDFHDPARWVDLRGLDTRREVIGRIRQFARAHPHSRWILGENWNEAAFEPSGLPTKEMLDAAVPDRPAFMLNDSGHDGWVNSRALAAAGITAATPDPPNGRIVRDAHGEPTGDLQESAYNLVERIIPPPTLQERVEALAAALAIMRRDGITGFVDAGVPPETMQAYRALEEQGRLEQHVDLCFPFWYSNPSEDNAQIRRFRAERTALAAAGLRADCVGEILLDGVYEGHTAALLEPYSDEPQKFGKGKLFIEPQRLDRLSILLDSAGFQIFFHAIGDAAVREGLDAYAATRRANGFRDNRDTIVHDALVTDTDIPRYRRLRVIADMQPLWSIDDPWETYFAPRLFGAARFKELYPTRTILDSGAVLAWGTDWPVTSVAPLDGIEAAITHRYPGGRDLKGQEDHAWKPSERVSLPQAIAAYTAGGAYLMHDERWRGSLVPGYAADLVVLDRNLFETPPLEIHAVPIDMTIEDGRVIFERSRQAAAAASP